MANKVRVSGVIEKIKMVKAPDKKTTWNCLEIHTGGSPGQPKGLPPASNVHFTVLCNDKQYNKLVNDLAAHGMKLKGQKMSIEGELVLDVSAQYVDGEVVINAWKLDSPELQRLEREQAAAAVAVESEESNLGLNRGKSSN